ncbi:MAG: type II secretion system protein [Burkholderiales bacterium]|jgi:MSHA pilin protein MshD|nr:type II secretion system protein [Burkholderiales bacterium]
MCIRERRARAAARGLSLIELIFFILIVGAGIAGILAILDYTAARSADPLVRKQVLTLAEGLMEEVLLMPFTFCDPDDPAAATAVNVGGCAVPEQLGPETGESRLGPTLFFDNVNDYARYGPLAPSDLAGNPIPGLAGYTVEVSVTAGGLGLPNDQVLQIDVTAAGPGNERVTLTAYRTRHSPNALP